MEMWKFAQLLIYGVNQRVKPRMPFKLNLKMRKSGLQLIGLAGENLVRYAAVMHDINRAAGRSGLGAVMGSKNLKAVAVRGTLKVGLADKALDGPDNPLDNKEL
jgi:hypothetical protein